MFKIPFRDAGNGKQFGFFYFTIADKVMSMSFEDFADSFLLYYKSCAVAIGFCDSSPNFHDIFTIHPSRDSAALPIGVLPEKNEK